MPRDLRDEAGSYLKKEYLAKRTSIERVQEIIARLELVIITKFKGIQQYRYALARVGTEYPEINQIIVDHLASI